VKKRRSPQEKKELSLKKDRRSIFEANPEASRKGVRRSKRSANKISRHNVRQALDAGLGSPTEATVDSVEAAVAKSKKRIFKKVGDDSLRNHISIQRQKRAHRDKFGNGTQLPLNNADRFGSSPSNFDY